MIDEKIKLLGDSFKGLWELREIHADNYVVANRNDTKIYWYVTFKYNGEYIDTSPRDTIEEALDYAINFLGL